MHSTVLTGRYSIAPLTWLIRHDLLCEFSSHFFQWLESLGAASHEFDIDGYLDDLDPGYESIDICGRSIDVEKLAAHLTQLHASLLSAESDVEILEPLWIAESLGSWSKKTQAVLTTDLGEVFVSNWKFDQAMRADSAPMLAFVAHLREPVLSPDSLSYAQLIQAIDKTLSGVTSIAEVVDRLRQQGIRISRALLTSVIRNECRYLLVYTGGALCANKAEDALKAWRLAAALFDTSEYLKSTGLGFDGKSFWQTSYTVDSSGIKKFFDFHQRGIAWGEFDWLEICLKLSHIHSNESSRTQGIPTAVHRFIVDWIVAHGRIWRTADSERTLGRSFEFDPEDVSPGRLMVYGNSEAGRHGSGSLVVREMVSRGKQFPGLIHSSRIATPFEEVTISVNAREVDSILRAQSSFATYGLTHVDDLAEHLLRMRGHSVLPYTLKLSRLACASLLPAVVYQVGRGLLVDQAFGDSLVDVSTIDQRRRRIIDHFASLGIGRHQLRESLSQRVANALFG
ncbi:hypothetical protein [Lysobacter enzymogenes]|uniref:hypothetical protein n=1 Tax=Lysobacter enzymogenes TaxID=69 RepID=UPI001AF4EF52|nr:hypothetical protein [Lysobacter enzymogenes]QQP99557.1 hypothetical protein JHW41_15690 [Lysobacter enzymogenes]